jgi:hypothetical protein
MEVCRQPQALATLPLGRDAGTQWKGGRGPRADLDARKKNLRPRRESQIAQDRDQFLFL